MQSTEEPISEMSSESQVRELERKIEDAIQKLPEQCGIIFRMSRFRQLKYKEIADILGISVKTVENQMGKALKLMRMNLADYLGAILIVIHILIENFPW
jgi:RNA polymerase sigma-70 factor (ECF subfamily)